MLRSFVEASKTSEIAITRLTSADAVLPCRLLFLCPAASRGVLFLPFAAVELPSVFRLYLRLLTLNLVTCILNMHTMMLMMMIMMIDFHWIIVIFSSCYMCPRERSCQNTEKRTRVFVFSVSTLSVPCLICKFLHNYDYLFEAFTHNILVDHIIVERLRCCLLVLRSKCLHALFLSAWHSIAGRLTATLCLVGVELLRSKSVEIGQKQKVDFNTRSPPIAACVVACRRDARDALGLILVLIPITCSYRNLSAIATRLTLSIVYRYCKHKELLFSSRERSKRMASSLKDRL
jgi:hypothetical protein